MDVNRRQLLTGAGAVGIAAVAAPSLRASGNAAPPVTTPAAPTPAGAGVLLSLFANPTFNGQISFCLGGASSGTAEIGEVMATVDQINAVTGDPDEPDTTAADFETLVQAFVDLGDRLERLARRSGRSDEVSYRQRMMRASSYAAQALFFVLGGTEPQNEADYFRICQERWLKAARRFPRPVRTFHVSSPYGEIPCYFFPSPHGSGRRPTLIVSSGSDGQLVECMGFGVVDGLERGYNVVLFEGPGQMSLLFEKHETFTPDWDQVIGPIVEALRRRRDVGRIGLVGVSFAGMLCARAAANLDLDATVLMPAAWNATLLWGDQTDMNTVKQTHDLPKAQKAQARRELNAGFAEAWPHLSRTTQFGVYKRGEIYDAQVMRQGRRGVPVSDYYQMLENILPFVYEHDLRRIRRPVMLTRNQGDQFFNGGQGHPPTPTTGKWDQPRYAFSLLDRVAKRDKWFVNFTASQGASLHDQPLAPQFANEVMFGWLRRRMSGDRRHGPG
ncbi:MAG: hypothetical protein U0R64_02920 [Candidatus Nanopelagicales bacterium]